MVFEVDRNLRNLTQFGEQPVKLLRRGHPGEGSICKRLGRARKIASKHVQWVGNLQDLVKIRVGRPNEGSIIPISKGSRYAR